MCELFSEAQTVEVRRGQGGLDLFQGGVEALHLRLQAHHILSGTGSQTPTLSIIGGLFLQVTALDSVKWLGFRFIATEWMLFSLILLKGFENISSNKY